MVDQGSCVCVCVCVLSSPTLAWTTYRTYRSAPLAKVTLRGAQNELGKASPAEARVREDVAQESHRGRGRVEPDPHVRGERAGRVCGFFAPPRFAFVRWACMKVRHCANASKEKCRRQADERRTKARLTQSIASLQTFLQDEEQVATVVVLEPREDVRVPRLTLVVQEGRQGPLRSSVHGRFKHTECEPRRRRCCSSHPRRPADVVACPPLRCTSTEEKRREGTGWE